MSNASIEPGPNASLERYVIPNLRNACRTLKLLRGHPGGLKASEIARMLGIPVTTTMRITATLQIEGLVQKNDGRYGLGPALIHLGNAALAGTDIRKLALPLLEKVTQQTSETSHLAIPCNERSLVIAVHDSPHPFRRIARGVPGRPALLGHRQDLPRVPVLRAVREVPRGGAPLQAHRAHAHQARRTGARSRPRAGGATASTTRSATPACAAWPRPSSRPTGASSRQSASPPRPCACPKRGPQSSARVRAVAMEASRLLGYSEPE